MLAVPCCYIVFFTINIYFTRVIFASKSIVELGDEYVMFITENREIRGIEPEGIYL